MQGLWLGDTLEFLLYKWEQLQAVISFLKGE